MKFDPTRPFEVTAIKNGKRIVYGAAFNLLGGRILQTAAKIDPAVSDVLIFNRNVDPRTNPLRDRTVA